MRCSILITVIIIIIITAVIQFISATISNTEQEQRCSTKIRWKRKRNKQ